MAFDKKLYREYVTRGPYVAFCVWPALCQSNDMSVLCKGVAEATKDGWKSLKFVKRWKNFYNSTQNTSLIRELDLNLVLWKQTALSRACFISTKKPFKKMISADIYTSAGGAMDKTLTLVFLCF